LHNEVRGDGHGKNGGKNDGVGAALFCLVLAIFYRIGMLVGECLEAAGPPLQGYTLNLAGSLAGTLAFTALVFFSLPPWAWILPVFAGLVYFSSQRIRDALILGAVLALIAATEISSPVQWSPYDEREYPEHPGNQGVRHMAEHGAQHWQSASGRQKVRGAQVPAPLIDPDIGKKESG
jgi:hypothetical protein